MKIYEPVVEIGSCFMCGKDTEDAPRQEQWRFKFEGMDDVFWLCKDCRSQFNSQKEFDEFRDHFASLRLYRNVSTLKRLLILKAPQVIIANAIKVIVGTALREDSLRTHVQTELEKIIGNGRLHTEDSKCL